jgi:O-antigen/teichoic acid export membrane protein
VLSLKQKAIKGVKWTVFETVFAVLSSPLLLILKAQFLSPSEFAALAIVTIFIGLFQTLENFGISQAVIQTDKLDNKETSSLFFFNIILSFCLGLSLFLLSSKIANSFNMSELSYLLKVTSLIVTINGPSLLFRAFLEKALHFKELSLIKMATHLFVILVTVLFLYMGLGVLAVVLGQIVSVSISAVFVVVLSIKNKACKIIFYFSFARVKPFLKFGAFVSAKQAMTELMHHMDELIIGYFLSREILGVYHFAKKMLEQLRSLITASFTKVLFPLLSKLKQDNERLTNVYVKISKYVAIFSFPVFTGISMTAHLFVPLIFGDEWAASIVYFRIFSITLIFLVLTANIATTLLYSVGKPNVVFYIDVVVNLLYLVSLFLFARRGPVVVLLVYSGYVIFKTLILQYYSNKYMIISFLKYILSFKNVLLSTFFMVACIFLVEIVIAKNLNILSNFLLIVLVGIASYSLGVLVLERHSLEEIKFAFLKGKV